MKIEQITIQDFDEVHYLFHRYINTGIGIDTYLNHLFLEETMLGLKCMLDDTCISAILICSQGIRFTIPKPELEKKISLIAGEEPVYTIDAIITRKPYRDLKLQHRLFKKMSALLRERNINWVLLEQWIKAGQTQSDYSVDSHFQTKYDLGVFPNFYGDIMYYNIICPICKDKPYCNCGASISLYHGLL